MAKGSSLGSPQATEGSAIERQWDESTPMGGFPAENAAIPGRRVATRINGASPAGTPPGGEGNGTVEHQGFRGSKRLVQSGG